MPVHPKPASAEGSGVQRGKQSPLRGTGACYVASEETSGPREISGPAWLSLGHPSYLRHSPSWSQGQEDQQVSLRGVIPSPPPPKVTMLKLKCT